MNPNDQLLQNTRLQELATRSDFTAIMVDVMSPLLMQGMAEEPTLYEELFTPFPMSRDTVKFPSFKGLVVGKITDGQDIPFINLGTGKVDVTVEDYGVRAGFTHQMIRDDQYDVIRYTTLELGKAHKRTKNLAAFTLLEAGAGTSAAAAQNGTLALADIRAAKKAASLFKEDGTNIARPVYFTHILIHPNQVDDLIPAKMTDLPPGVAIDPVTGDLRGLCGLKVIVTAHITDGVAILVKAKDKILYCEREALQFAQNSDFGKRIEEVRSTEAYTFAVLYGDNVRKITGC